MVYVFPNIKQKPMLLMQIMPWFDSFVHMKAFNNLTKLEILAAAKLPRYFVFRPACHSTSVTQNWTRLSLTYTHFGGVFFCPRKTGFQVLSTIQEGDITICVGGTFWDSFLLYFQLWPQSGLAEGCHYATRCQVGNEYMARF